MVTLLAPAGTSQLRVLMPFAQGAAHAVPPAARVQDASTARACQRAVEGGMEGILRGFPNVAMIGVRPMPGALFRTVLRKSYWER